MRCERLGRARQRWWWPANRGGILATKRTICALLAIVLACAPADGPQPGATVADVAEAEATTACRMPTGRTTVRAEGGAIIETWQFPLDDVLTDELPDEPAFVQYRAAIMGDGADLRQPVADPPEIDSEELAAIWEDEFYNQDLVFEESLGSVDPISCLDALLFTRQAARVSQLEHPTEFSASALRRDTPDGIRVLVVFGAGSEMFVPRGFYGFDVVGDSLAAGWEYWYAIHNHTIQTNRGRLALGVPVPSTSDVQLLRALAADLGLDSVRVTNGFYTFNAAVHELSRFRAR